MKNDSNFLLFLPPKKSAVKLSIAKDSIWRPGKEIATHLVQSRTKFSRVDNIFEQMLTKV